jgi:tripartite-type tricarboxylate transporter receptor subunit TctC
VSDILPPPDEPVMHRPRRRFLKIAAGAAAAAALSRFAWAQAYPSRPVRLVVGTAAGSVQDILSRVIAQWLAERLGQPFVIDNRVGAGTNLATEAVVRAPADGYTLLSVGPSSAVNATLYPKLAFNFIRDIAPVASMVHQSQVVVLNPAMPVATMGEFLAYTKANPGKVNFASSGVGTGNQLAVELFKMVARVDMVHVPYRGAGPAMIDLIGGQVQVMFVSPVVAMEHIKSGKLRALAVTTVKRDELLPELPPVADTVPGYESSAWFGLGAPHGTPAEIVDLLNKTVNAGLADPKMRGRYTELGGGIVASTPAEFGKLIADETEKWGRVVKFAGLKPA